MARGRTGLQNPGEAEALAFLGLARRAGAVVIGVDAVKRSLGAGDLDLVVFAGDASPVQLRKVKGLAGHRGVPIRWVSMRSKLGQAIGAGPVSVAGVQRGSFSKRLLGGLAESPPDPPEGGKLVE